MKLNALNRLFSNTVRSQKSGWNWPDRSRQCLTQRTLGRKLDRRPSWPVRVCHGNVRPKPSVEAIEVSADRTSMYCKGLVRTRDSSLQLKVIVAVEWLDEDRKALNTDWKQIEMDMAGKAAPRLLDTLQPFTVKAPLDRRVKWVKAYAFSGNK